MIKEHYYMHKNNIMKPIKMYRKAPSDAICFMYEKVGLSTYFKIIYY
jgi:hypothetical protein